MLFENAAKIEVSIYLLVDTGFVPKTNEKKSSEKARGRTIRRWDSSVRRNRSVDKGLAVQPSPDGGILVDTLASEAGAR